MDAVKHQLKQMYLLLVIAYIFGFIMCAIWQPAALLSFTFGTFVSAINFYLTYVSFGKLFQQSAQPAHVLLAGPLPKLVTIVIGTIVCHQLPAFFSVVFFLVGVCLYPIVYLCLAAMDYLANKKQ